MNEKTIIFCQIFLFLFFSNINFIILLPCEEYSFCFDCISNSTCTWDNNKCLAINELKGTKSYINTELTPKKCFHQNDNSTLDYIAEKYFIISTTIPSQYLFLCRFTIKLYMVQNLYIVNI